MERKNGTIGQTSADELTTQDILQLPLAKIKKIFNTDPENPTAFKKAHIAAGISTQLFIEKFIEHAITVHQMHSKKASANRLTYDDLAEVAHFDPFVFLKLLIPPRVELIEAYNKEQLRYCFMDENQKAVDVMKEIGLVNEKNVPRDEDFSDSDGERNDVGDDDDDEEEEEEEEEEAIKKLNLAEKVVQNEDEVVDDEVEVHDEDMEEEDVEEEDDDMEEEEEE